MRRIVVLLVVALVGAGFAGRLVGNDAVRVNATALSTSATQEQMSVVAQHPVYACYLESELRVALASTSSTFSSSAAATIAKLDVEALSIEDYMVRTYHWSPSAIDLRQARVAYEGDLTNAAAASGNSCGAPVASVISALPTSFVNQQVRANAASLALISHLRGVIALTSAGVEGFFNAHKSAYDTLCFSFAEVPANRLSAFAHDQSLGWSVAKLARTFSVDATASKGGSLGCFTPTSSQYVAARTTAQGLTLNQFPSQPRQYNSGTAVYGIYYAITSRTPSTFALAVSRVLSDARSINAELASRFQLAMLTHASVQIDPNFGRWSQKNVTVKLPATPLSKFVPNNGTGLVL